MLVSSELIEALLSTAITAKNLACCSGDMGGNPRNQRKSLIWGVSGVSEGEGVTSSISGVDRGTVPWPTDLWDVRHAHDELLECYDYDHSVRECAALLTGNQEPTDPLEVLVEVDLKAVENGVWSKEGGEVPTPMSGEIPFQPYHIHTTDM